jgi:hypothetical protein
MTDKFGELTSWELDNAKTRFDQMFRQYTVNNPSWGVELVKEPEIVLTGYERQRIVMSPSMCLADARVEP